MKLLFTVNFIYIHNDGAAHLTVSCGDTLFHIYEVAATQFKHNHRQSCLQVSRLPMIMFKLWIVTIFLYIIVNSNNFIKIAGIHTTIYYDIMTNDLGIKCKDCDDYLEWLVSKWEHIIHIYIVFWTIPQTANAGIMSAKLMLRLKICFMHILILKHKALLILW